MVRQKRPGIAGGFRLWEEASQGFKKILPALGISEDLSALDPPVDDMVQNTGSVKAGCS
jgi:hypothetical protein